MNEGDLGSEDLSILDRPVKRRRNATNLNARPSYWQPMSDLMLMLLLLFVKRQLL